jgi:hypothetical protein
MRKPRPIAFVAYKGGISFLSLIPLYRFWEEKEKGSQVYFGMTYNQEKL